MPFIHVKCNQANQHAFSQSEAMQLPNHRPEKLDTLSQHAIETNHRLGKLDILSQHTQYRQAIPACTAKSKLYERCYKSLNSGQADTAK